MEILELRDHPWFVGVQFHPEYLSRVLEPSRPYLGFLAASAGCFEEVVGQGKKQARLSYTPDYRLFLPSNIQTSSSPIQNAKYKTGTK